jgi:hypothetical protein
MAEVRPRSADWSVWSAHKFSYALYWDEILPAAVASLPLLHREILTYVMSIPGRRRISFAHAMRTWNLDRGAFDAELGLALAAVRHQLRRIGVTSAGDLDIR